MTSAWTAADVARIAAAPLPALPVIDDAPPLLPGIDVWDLWPVRHLDGSIAVIVGGALWFALSAPAQGPPVERHARARLRLLHRVDDDWRDLGSALPEGLSPGSREWSGSAVLDAGVVTLYFTAAGRRGEAVPTFEQRLFVTQATVDGVRLGPWSVPVEAVASDGADYVVADQRDGTVGTIKAFRDPAYFRDPADGAEYLLFTASLARSTSSFNGAIGVARRDGGAWRLTAPLIGADGVNNELERPHVVVADGRYYLFWSTQASVFAGETAGPTGLYAMVADRFVGPWRPVNTSGLVVANPPSEPMQAYSWLVLPDRRVTSFVDQWRLRGRSLDSVDARAHFGGVPAPEFQLTIEGDRIWRS